MQVALISTFAPQACGIAAYTGYLIDALAAVDPTMSVTVLAEHGASRSNRAQVLQCFDGEADYVDQLLPQLRRLDVEVVHIQHEYGIFGVDERFLRLLSGIRDIGVPIVLTMHTVHTALSFDLGCSWRHRRPPLGGLEIERYQRATSNWADVVITHQDSPMREVLIRQGVASERVTTIPHGTLIRARRSRRPDGLGASSSHDSPVLVAFGYFEPAKNIQGLLQAFSFLRSTMPRAQLLVGGHIRYATPETLAYRASCEQAVADLGLSGNVTFMDQPLAESEVEGFFASADVACFVYDEDSRSSSGAFHRAIGCGIPAIASRIPKFVEVGEISDELLVNPRSPRSMAQLLSRILTDDAFRVDIGERAAKFAESTSWERVAMRHLSLYRDLSERRSDVTPSQVSCDALVP
jgi:glycosyltransferase involved in cell wall biosynthesis